MEHEVDRREFTLGFLTASFAALALTPGAAAATGGGVLDQPWAVWPKDAKPVRGGTFRVAAAQYIGKMNPNHWPVLDWISMGYFHERLMFTDGAYNPTVPWLAQELTFENPQSVLMRLRDGVTFHDGSPFNAESVKYQIDWIRNPSSNAWSVSWLAQLDAVEVVNEYTLRWKFKTPWAGFNGVVANVPGYVIRQKPCRRMGRNTTASRRAPAPL